MRRSRRARPRPRVLLAPRRTRGTDAFSFPAGGCCLCPGGRVVPLLFGGRRRRGPPVGAHEAGVRWLMAPPTSHLLSSLGDEGRDRGRELCVAAHGRHRPTAHRPPPPLWLHGRLAACRPCLVAGKDGGGGVDAATRPPPPARRDGRHGGVTGRRTSAGGLSAVSLSVPPCCSPSWRAATTTCAPQPPAPPHPLGSTRPSSRSSNTAAVRGRGGGGGGGGG